jgi:hypothetical protein
MNRKINYILIVTLLITIVKDTSAESVTIYRWVDKNDVVHFSQYQPEDGNFTEMNVANADPVESTLSSIPSPINEENTIKSIDIPPSTEESFESEMNDKCQEAQTNVTTLKSFDNVQILDNDGKKSILTLQQKQQQLKMNLKRVDVYCSQ